MTRPREPLGGRPEAEAAHSESGEEARQALMARHAAARQRRDSAPLGSEEFRAAAEDVARIEIAIAAIVERSSA